MDKEYFLILVIILGVVLFVLSAKSPKKIENDKLKVSIIFHILIELMTLCMSALVFTGYYESDFSRKVMISALYTIFIVYVFIKQTIPLIKLNRVQTDRNNVKILFYVIMMVWMSCFILFSSFNMIMCILFPNSFIFENNISGLEKIFEIIYYTFSLMITYSGSRIVVYGLYPKLVQIVEIMYFYFCIGGMACSIIQKHHGEVL